MKNYVKIAFIAFLLFCALCCKAPPRKVTIVETVGNPDSHTFIITYDATFLPSEVEANIRYALHRESMCVDNVTKLDSKGEYFWIINTPHAMHTVDLLKKVPGVKVCEYFRQ